MVDYGNWKLNEIFNDTFPNLGWAKRMDDKPKFAGNYEGPLYAPHPDLTGPYPDEMFEEAARREAALKAVDKLYEENGDAMKQLAEIEKEEKEKLNAGFKQDADGNWYRPELKDFTRNERIELAEKEIAYIVMGGQDGREYAGSIAFILQVLDSLRDE